VWQYMFKNDYGLRLMTLGKRKQLTELEKGEGLTRRGGKLGESAMQNEICSRGVAEKDRAVND